MTRPTDNQLLDLGAQIAGTYIPRGNVETFTQVFAAGFASGYSAAGDHSWAWITPGSVYELGHLAGQACALCARKGWTA